MKPRRTLSLSSETLTELTTDELHGVAGGQDTNNCASRDCHTAAFTCPFGTLTRLIPEPDLTNAGCA